MRKVNAYARNCNQRLRGLAPQLAAAMTSEHGQPATINDTTACLQHAEAFLFHARRGAWLQARAALANTHFYAAKVGAVAADVAVMQRVLP